MTKELATIESKEVAKRKTVLVAPLNWGLGHATRCMPVINCLLAKGAKVILASDGNSLELLRHEYPELETLELPGYHITYSSANMVRNIAPQITTIIKTINEEKKWLRQMIEEHEIDAVISDNRYGLFNPSIPCIFLTHQINIILPDAISGVVNFQNRRYIKRFKACWVPDFEGTPNLSGKLSHKTKIRHPKYIGPLSRLETVEAEKRYRAAIILSGPEPQRTILEDTILNQIDEDNPNNFILIRGVPSDPIELLHPGIDILNFATAKELSSIIAHSDVVIARSGYSTIMDLVKLGSRAILIPTPGQTEQEYLGAQFHNAGQFYCCPQDGFNLNAALQAAGTFTGFQLEQQPDLLDKAVEGLLNSL